MPAQATVWGRRWLLAGAALGDAAPAPAPDTGPTPAGSCRHQTERARGLLTGAKGGYTIKEKRFSFLAK